jgi:hypothetical protein
MVSLVFVSVNALQPSAAQRFRPEPAPTSDVPNAQRAIIVPRDSGSAARPGAVRRPSAPVKPAPAEPIIQPVKAVNPPHAEESAASAVATAATAPTTAAVPATAEADAASRAAAARAAARERKECLRQFADLWVLIAKDKPANDPRGSRKPSPEQWSMEAVQKWWADVVEAWLAELEASGHNPKGQNAKGHDGKDPNEKGHDGKGHQAKNQSPSQRTIASARLCARSFT